MVGFTKNGATNFMAIRWDESHIIGSGVGFVPHLAGFSGRPDLQISLLEYLWIKF